MCSTLTGCKQCNVMCVPWISSLTSWIFILVGENPITQTNSSSPSWKAESYWFGNVFFLHAAFLSSHFSWLYLFQPHKHILISSDDSRLFYHKNWAEWHADFNWLMTFPIFVMLLLVLSLTQCKHLKGQIPGTLRWGNPKCFLQFFFFCCSPRVSNCDRHF